MLLQQLSKFIEENSLLNKEEKILVGVSGGVDSVVLLHSLTKLKYNCSIAHCNFKLRGNDSDEDEKLVISLAEELKIPIYTKSFETLDFAKKNSISIQMAARQLRLNWLNELTEEHNFNKLCFAHHLNDNIETLFINLLRGTGVNGLKGILSLNENICRPLLFATKNQIVEYAKKENIQFREDLSNKESYYLRNKIRNKIIPEFEKQIPNFYSKLSKNLTNIKSDVLLYNELVEKYLIPLIVQNENVTMLDFRQLSSINNFECLIFHFLQKFSFNSDIAKEICNNIDHTEERFFYSKDFVASRKNSLLTIKPISEQIPVQEYLIQNIHDFSNVSLPFIIENKTLESKNIKCLKLQKDEALFDIKKLKFPLTIRTYLKGDFFVPFGMTGKQLLSDFFINQKFTKAEKENTWLLCSNNEVIWVIGHRTSNKFKIENQTDLAIYLKVHNYICKNKN